MTEFLQSLKTDLLSRRLLPFVALVAVALLAAAVYAVSAGSSASSSTPQASVPAPSIASKGSLGVTVAPANPNEAVAETPSGTRYQSHGPTRDPFIPLPTPPAKSNGAGSNSSKASSSSSAGSSSSGSSSSTGSGSGSGSNSGSGKGSGGQPAPEAPTPAPKKKAKPQFPYVVSILFGRTSVVPGQPATLAPFEELKLGQQLPSAQDARIALEHVSGNGSAAIFKLLAPPILHGSGVCLPSTSECQTIELEPGHSEELEYVEASGEVVAYELKLVSIVRKAGKAAAARLKRGAKAARLSRHGKPMRQARAEQAIGSASEIIWRFATSSATH